MPPQPTDRKGTYKDPNLRIDERVKDLISHMTLEEKVAQLSARWLYDVIEGRTFSLDKAKAVFVNGVGGISRIGGWSVLDPKGNAELANAIQAFLISSTRLGIPAIVHDECCSGYMARGATIFPQPIGLASTWSPELIEEMTSVVRTQMRAVGTHQGLAPVLDVTRDPRWGRIEETFGEDPYLISSMGVSYIRGLQGKDIRTGVMATGKHFVGHGMSEGGMNAAPPHIPPRELAEVYLAPFAAAIQEANLASIMPAIHELDGVPISGDAKLLTELLREKLGFSGLVVSDYEAIRFLIDLHHVAKNKQEAARLGLRAGISMELHFPDCYAAPLLEAVQSGRVQEQELDRAVVEVLTAKFRLGLFENPYVDSARSAEVFDAPEHRILAHRIACQSIVLLKNSDRLLPLQREQCRIAVIGPNADESRHMLGDYCHLAHIEEQLLRNPLAPGWLDGAERADATTVLQGIKHKAAASSAILYAKGCDLNNESRAGFDEAVSIARRADVAILVLGDKSGLTPECTSGETRDNADLRLPGVQEDLVLAIAETGTPVVLVLVSGRVPCISRIVDHVGAVIESWVPGEEGGNAVADVLFGDFNPGGKLPITFPRSPGQIPIYYSHKPTGGHSLWYKDYTLLSSQPLFPFGFGLSYTEFKYRDLEISPVRVKADAKVCIRVAVTNVGKRAGDEVVQLYLHDPEASITRPVKELKGFQRVSLLQGQTGYVEFGLDTNQLGFYDNDMAYIVEPGTYEIMIGSSSEDIRLKGQFEVIAEEKYTPQRRIFFSSVRVTKK
jgi:beta-glucosidase